MPPLGTTVAHYEILSRLGAGGMGEVYRGRDTRLGREVALKFIDPDFRRDPDRRARLLREARAASLLRSSAVATTYDIGEAGDDLFIVMELVDGEPLAARITRGPLPVPEVITLAEPIADALDEAHGLGIVHRDIKSANLMLTGRGGVKVLDFGLVKEIRPAQAGNARETMAETGLGVVVGTIDYLSPEQALGRPVDGRSDLFSLGVVLYESLTGQRPFVGHTVSGIVDQIINHEPIALARLNYGVPPRLDLIVRKLLAKRPDERYQTARDLLVDVRGLQKDLAIERSSGVLLGVPAAMTQPARPPLANAVAVFPFVNITRDPADDWIGSGIAETVMADVKSITGVTVIGRERVFDALRQLSSTSSAGHLDDEVSIDVGHRLRATWLVTGGYQRLGNLVRITARVVDVASGTVWRTVKIDGAMTDIFELQDKIVFELSQGLNVRLNRQEVAAIERRETESVEAYADRSQAITDLLEGTPHAIDRAIERLERATTRDPGYAAAWAALGTAYDLKASFLSMPALADRAIAAARTAIALEPTLADAHRWLGLALMSKAHYDEAILAIEEAARLSPDDPGVQSALGRAYWVGRGQLDEGILHLERAAHLDPDLGYAHQQLGLLYALRGDYAKAEAACLHAIDHQTRSASSREGLRMVGCFTRLGYVYYRQGRYDEARATYEREVAALAESEHALKERSLIDLEFKIGATHLRLGSRDRAEQHFTRAIDAFEARVKRGADDPHTKYYMAALWSLRGDAERAIRCLGESCQQLPALNRARAIRDPDFDPIRDDPRFIAVLETAGGSGAWPARLTMVGPSAIRLTTVVF